MLIMTTKFKLHLLDFEGNKKKTPGTSRVPGIESGIAVAKNYNLSYFNIRSSSLLSRLIKSLDG